jgi:hypothetical protein
MKNPEIRGMEKGIKKTALSMLADGLQTSVISKYTGISTSEIESLNHM